MTTTTAMQHGSVSRSVSDMLILLTCALVVCGGTVRAQVIASTMRAVCAGGSIANGLVVDEREEVSRLGCWVACARLEECIAAKYQHPTCSLYEAFLCGSDQDSSVAMAKQVTNCQCRHGQICQRRHGQTCRLRKPIW